MSDKNYRCEQCGMEYTANDPHDFGLICPGCKGKLVHIEKIDPPVVRAPSALVHIHDDFYVDASRVVSVDTFANDVVVAYEIPPFENVSIKTRRFAVGIDQTARIAKRIQQRVNRGRFAMQAGVIFQPPECDCPTMAGDGLHQPGCDRGEYEANLAKMAKEMNASATIRHYPENWGVFTTGLIRTEGSHSPVSLCSGCGAGVGELCKCALSKMTLEALDLPLLVHPWQKCAAARRTRVYRYRRPTAEGVMPPIMAPVDMPGLEVRLIGDGDNVESVREHPSFDVVPEGATSPLFMLGAHGEWRQVVRRGPKKCEPTIKRRLGSPGIPTNAVRDAMLLVETVKKIIDENFPGNAAEVTVEALGNPFPPLGLNEDYIGAFALGKPVRLKNGSHQTMYIEAVNGDLRQCRWTKPSGLVERAQFAVELLEAVNDA